jgi:hypothetical protein
MGKNYVIDRRTLPYDAFVPDESWLIPIDEEGGDSHGDKGPETDADSNQGAGRQSGKKKTERE